MCSLTLNAEEEANVQSGGQMCTVKKYATCRLNKCTWWVGAGEGEKEVLIGKKMKRDEKTGD